jgi:hypothetical protein
MKLVKHEMRYFEGCYLGFQCLSRSFNQICGGQCNLLSEDTKCGQPTTWPDPHIVNHKHLITIYSLAYVIIHTVRTRIKCSSTWC